MYNYDANNRLRTTSETSGATITKTTYYYDRNGNTLTKMSEITDMISGQTATGDLSETSDFVEMYEYDVLNRMVSSTANEVTATYKYRPDGLRYSKTVDGVETAHTWDGTNIISDVVNGALSKTYVRGIGLIASKSSNVSTYYFFNGHGDVVQFGNTMYDYDAFGNERNPSDSDTNSFRYCGEYWDSETGTLYLRARYYDARTGRFTSEDPIGAGLNWYTYANCNPILFYDPWGLIPTKEDAAYLASEIYNLTDNDLNKNVYNGWILNQLFIPVGFRVPFGFDGATVEVLSLKIGVFSRTINGITEYVIWYNSSGHRGNNLL